ncbi:hypothetical protein J2Z32_002395 [Paenibacillus turicensis]|uniref:Uncharacterized protein n=1 Tax=Paenibacillus turicensis TaxID=160487 RepID=A0ABS4FT37_9BACL|nr:hypothetical protein [Paenibacillus turicensis]MBP1905747.1 hypothetical protein [Paenibacillus turicensis]
MKKEKYLFYYLFLFLLMSVGAFIWQVFFTDIAQNYSVWGLSIGWQTEIALWNVGIDVGIIITLFKRNVEYAKILSIISFFLCIMLGGHHLIYALTATNGNTSLHWMGAIEVLLIGGGAGVWAILKAGCFNKQ